MNTAILDKINSKLIPMLNKDSLNLSEAMNLMTVLRSCYNDELNSITMDIQKILRSKNKQYSNTLNNFENISFGKNKIMIDGKESSILSIERLTEIFKDQHYSQIKLAYCLIPENLILLSLEKEISA